MSQGLHNNIFGSGNEISAEEMQAYLEGRLSAEEARRVEEALSQDGMISDAIDGLQELPPTDARQSVGQINNYLQQEILARKKRKRNNYFNDQKWSWLGIVIILILLVVAFLVIRISLKK